MPRRRDLITKLPLGLLGIGAGMSWGSRLLAAGSDADAITVAFPSDVANWDPISSSNTVTVSIHKCLFDMPLQADPNAHTVPGVVSQYRWVDATATALELTLRPDVTFHNGEPLTSDDIRFTLFERAKADPSLMLSIVWGRLADIETPSPTRAILKFSEPFNTAPQFLTVSPSFIYPRRYYEKVGRDGFVQNPIGSGPYRLVDYQRNSRIVFEAYDKYWGGPAKIKRVTFQIINDVSARIAAVQGGQVDFAHNLPVREVVRLGQTPGLVGSLDAIDSDMLIQMVNKGIYQDQNLRLALHHAIDKVALSKAFFNGKAVPLSTWEGPGEPANDPNFKFAFSPDQARELLAKSGYSMEKPAKVQFYTFNGVFANDYDMARAIVQMWKQVGINAELEVIETNKYFALTSEDKMDAPVLYSWTNTLGDPESFASLLNPSKRFSLWKSPDIPPRLNPLLTEVDYDKRVKGYLEFDQWAVEQGYAFPLLQGIGTVVHAKRLNYVPFKNGMILPYFWSLA